MTPEQQAWFEYGRSRGWLKAHRSKKYFADVPDMGLYAWHVERDMHGLDALIRDVWRKRAACREWVSLKNRYCCNCFYSSSRRCAPPCSQCWGYCLWKPRKERVICQHD